MKEYRTVDKSAWARGEWDNEPDKVSWTDAATGLPCLIVRGPSGPSGALCGYVGVAEGHRLFGVDYSDARLLKAEEGDGRYFDVHGGLTFSDHCSPSEDESRGICHVPEPGAPDHVWWFGFDCAHGGDVCPMPGRSFDWPDQSYKDLRYVRHHVTSLAAQLAGASA